MSAAADELLAPLGQAERRPPAARRRVPVAPVLGALAGGLAAILLGTIALVDDPLGGEPHAVVPIVVKPAPAVPVAEVPKVSLAPASPQRSAAEVEAQSGVSVVRPSDAAAPASVVIRVPDAAMPVRLNPAPDRRLVERSRHGLLPRIGTDGARPSQVYARPGGAPAGMQVAGRVAILVTGLGIGQGATAEATDKLPPAVSLAFAPYGGDLERQVARAREEGHEVMLQIPMEPFDYPDNDPGPQTLTVKASAQDNLERLRWAMGRFTGYTGLVNFMGGRLTSDEGALAPILSEAGTRGLLVLDDATSPRSLIGSVGERVRASTARADVVLDALPRADAIDKELARLEEIARRRGVAVGTASGLPTTIERIARWASALEGRGIVLVPVSAAFAGGTRP